MKRKLVKQGPATMMISLPASWIRQHGLMKGSSIELDEFGQDLLIKADTSTKEKKATISLSGFHPLTNRVVIALYVKGIDELELTFDSKADAENIKVKVIDELLGFEVIKKSQESILLKDFTSPEKQNIDDIIRRIFFILDSMVEELIEAIKRRHSMNPVIEIDKAINKFCHFASRTLNKYGHHEPSKTGPALAIVSLLEEIGDIYKHIAQEVADGASLDKKHLHILRLSQVALFHAKELVFSFSKNEIVQFAKRYEEIRKEIKTKHNIDAYLFFLNESITKFNGHLLLMWL